jgi:hypothetical protein
MTIAAIIACVCAFLRSGTSPEYYPETHKPSSERNCATEYLDSHANYVRLVFCGVLRERPILAWKLFNHPTQPTEGQDSRHKNGIGHSPVNAIHAAALKAKLVAVEFREARHRHSLCVHFWQGVHCENGTGLFAYLTQTSQQPSRITVCVELWFKFACVGQVKMLKNTALGRVYETFPHATLTSHESGSTPCFATLRPTLCASPSFGHSLPHGWVKSCNHSIVLIVILCRGANKELTLSSDSRNAPAASGFRQKSPGRLHFPPTWQARRQQMRTRYTRQMVRNQYLPAIAYGHPHALCLGSIS